MLFRSDGVANLMTQVHGTYAAGLMSTDRGTNPTDSGAPFYEVYQCADGHWISLAPVEKKFYEQALRILELPELLEEQWDRSRWPAAKARIACAVRTRTRAQWVSAFEGVEACFAPVLTLDEAPRHPHLEARGTYAEIDGVPQPMPAPRFSRTPPAAPRPFQPWRTGTAASVLAPWLDAARIERAKAEGLLE